MKSKDAGKVANPNKLRQWVSNALRKYRNNSITEKAMASSNSTDNITINSAGSITSTVAAVPFNPVTASYYHTSAGAAGQVLSVSNGGSGGSSALWGLYNGTGGASISTPTSSTVLTIYGSNKAELVRINNDGTVTWQDDVLVDEAANSFAQSLNIGAEKAAGITYGVKQRMRDAVFEEIISMAKEKGSLTSDDLTYLWQAAKIMDKLKGKE